jgi:hypothetical protein
VDSILGFLVTSDLTPPDDPEKLQTDAEGFEIAPLPRSSAQSVPSAMASPASPDWSAPRQPPAFDDFDATALYSPNSHSAVHSA